MAVDPAARRQEGVSPIPQADLEGSRTHDGRGVNLPTSTYRNPGATPNLRGVEANTGKSEGSNIGEPMIDTEPAGPVPRGVPFNTPDDSKGDVEGPAPDGWGTYDSSKNNTALPEPQVGSFTKFGEKYPGFGDPDNDGG